MPILNNRDLKAEAGERLRTAPENPKKMVLSYALIYGGVTILSVLLAQLLDIKIEKSSGLSELSTWSSFSAIRSLVTMVPSFFVLFWSMGYTHSILRAIRGKSSDIHTLNEGFYRFGPVLRHTLVWSALCMALSFVSSTPATLLFFAMPMSGEVNAILENQSAEELVTAEGLINPAVEESLVRAMEPMILLNIVIFLILLWIFSYSFRLSPFALMEDERCGALGSMARSMKLMRGNRMKLFKLDLSFWWYYLLLVLADGLLYADVLLRAMGIELPVSAEVSGLIAWILSTAVMIAVSILAKNRVGGTYALFYDKLLTSPEPEAKPDIPLSGVNNPWNYQ